MKIIYSGVPEIGTGIFISKIAHSPVRNKKYSSSTLRVGSYTIETPQFSGLPYLYVTHVPKDWGFIHTYYLYFGTPEHLSHSLLQ
jgi:hypothetical protein